MHLPILPKTGIIGVKKNFGENLSEGSVATFDVIAVGPDGQRTTRPNVSWSLYRVNNDYQWYRADGRWNFERVKSSRRLADGKIDIAVGAPAKISVPVGLGTHRLDLRSDDVERHADEHHLRCRLVRGRHSTDARPARADARQGELHRGRKHGAENRLAFRRQGDGRDRQRCRAGDRDRRSEERRQRNPHVRRNELGRRRLCGRARASSARRRGKAHARPRARRRVVRHR